VVERVAETEGLPAFCADIMIASMCGRKFFRVHVWGMLSAFILLAGMAQGAEVQLPNYNCAITPPVGWIMETIVANKRQIAAFRDPSSASMLMIFMNTEKRVHGPVDEDFVREFERGVEESGGPKHESGNFIQVSGLKAYERFGDIDKNGAHASTMLLYVPTSDRDYQVTAVITEGKVKDRTEIRKAVESFRFLHEPAPPPQASDGKSAAYRAGELVGRALVIGIGVALVVYVVNKKNRRKGDTIPLPPPGQ